MSDPRWSTEFGSADEEIRRLVVAYDAAWTGLEGEDLLTVAARVLAPHRRGARQLSDGAVRMLVGAGLIALAEEAGNWAMLPANLAGAARLVNRFRVIVEESAGADTVPDLLSVADETLDHVPPDPMTVETLAALGLARFWRDARGGSVG